MSSSIGEKEASWVEEDEVVTAILSVEGRGAAAKKRGVTDDDGSESMSDGERNERAALRRMMTGAAVQAGGRSCMRCRGPCREERTHFGGEMVVDGAVSTTHFGAAPGVGSQQATRDPDAWNRSRWDKQVDESPSLFAELTRAGRELRLR